MKTSPTIPEDASKCLDDGDVMRLLKICRGYFDLGMFDEAWEILGSIEAPPAMKRRVEGARFHVAYARCDMETAAAIGVPLSEGVQVHPLCYNMLAIALHHCGRWQEAVELHRSRLTPALCTQDDYFGLASYLGRALQFEESLVYLELAIRDDPSNGYKALVDTDFQAFWTKLIQAPQTPAMRAVLTSDAMTELAHRRLTDAGEFTWDPMDRLALPAVFGRWMRTNPAKLMGEMAHAAPQDVRRRFARWALSRARASQRLLRRAIQRPA